VLVDGRAAHVVALNLEFPSVRLGVEEGDDALHLGHGFEADAVTGEEEELVRRHFSGRPELGGKSGVLLARRAPRIKLSRLPWGKVNGSKEGRQAQPFGRSSAESPPVSHS
jgi:hypothetical protein